MSYNGRDIFGALVGTALLLEGTIRTNQKEWKDRIREEYANLQNLPRKKKKQEKKHLLLQWQIACYEPFTREYDFD